MSASTYRAKLDVRRSMAVYTSGFMLLIVLGLHAGCTSYNDRYGYTPRPALVTAATENEDAGSVRSLVSVVGVTTGDKQAGTPTVLEVRMRLRNDSNGDVRFDPQSLTLVDGSAKLFAPPTVVPAGPSNVAAGGSLEISALFPFPEGKFPAGMDLRALVVEWTVTLAGRKVAQAASFQRFYLEPYYDPYYYPPYFSYSYPYYYWPYYSPMHNHAFWY